MADATRQQSIIDLNKKIEEMQLLHAKQIEK